MVSPENPPTGPERSKPPVPSFRRQLGFSAGLGAGLALWLIIGLATDSAILGFVFGLVPGVVIGVGLKWTAWR